MNINLELYKIFYSVAKNLNITKASSELMISQPGVSKAIKNLENQLGCSLFVRTKSGVLLTDEGKVFYTKVKQAMELIEHAEKSIMEMVNLEAGFLNIGISNTLTKKYLLPYIEEFHNLHPKIKIKIFTNPTFELITKARNGLLDFIILNLPYEVPSDFSKYELKTVHDAFVANKNFAFLKDQTIPLANLNNYPLILLAQGSNTRYYLDKFCSSNHITLIPEIEIASFSLVTEFTKIGLGIGFITKEYLDQELDDNLFEIKTSPELPPRSIGMICLKNKSLSCSSKNFLKLLNQQKNN